MTVKNTCLHNLKNKIFFNRFWGNNLKINPPFGRSLKNQRGMVLVTAMVLLLVLALLAAVAVQWSRQNMARSKKYLQTRTAFYAAEAGIQMAMQRLNYDSSGNSPGEEIDASANNDMDEVLDSSTGLVANHSSDLTAYAFPVGSTGSFTVTIADNDDGDGSSVLDDDNAIVLTSVGTDPKTESTVTIEAIVFRPMYKAKAAIASNGDIDINGNPNIQGSLGKIHTNGTMTGTTNDADQGMTATESCSSPCSQGAALIDIPPVSPDGPDVDGNGIGDYKDAADIWLHSDGTWTDHGGICGAADTTYTEADLETVTCSGGVLNPANNKGIEYRSTGNSNLRGWYFQSRTKDGMYWVDHNAFIASADNYSDVTQAVALTILATGDIVTSGNSKVTNFTTGLSDEIAALFLISADDIDASGNFDQSFSIDGIISAEEQINLSGTVKMTGMVIAADDPASSSSVVTTNTIGGNFTITLNGNIVTPFLSDKVILLSWQENPPT